MTMAAPRKTVMGLKSYQNQAEVLVKNYLLSDPFLPYTSVLGGIFVCKMLFDLSQLVSALYFDTYSTLTKVQRMEWNNRAVSTIHAIFIATLSLYFVFWSDLFTDHEHADLVTFRSSQLSTFALGVSVGYFVADLGMIFWLYPSLGGVEYIRLVTLVLLIDSKLFKSDYTNMVKATFDLKLWNSIQRFKYLRTLYKLKASFHQFRLLPGNVLKFESADYIIVHHSLAAIAVAYALFTGEGQLYTFMVLISEVTTPEINMRWYLDTAGLKKSTAYLINGVVIFFAWMLAEIDHRMQVARILLFVYMFYHVRLHYNQVIKMHIIGFLLVFVVPSALAAMNLVWFGKILKGLKKTLSKKP
ncbi:hypothetical protein RHSIM_Rhsim13G0128500 [Rhododendron simsii]|uniref:TLC domain-containing protein n=1 Tax=Rhododendron simsii TaxID=118357 RepID=A0A834L5W5_RHOSS|nr:hypothetical protein RHSIM_Rhsim13G0128500 [Rhododendron simsii]